ncbi:MAG: hypothetical protein IJD04_04785, partial [Desulfovibrionaceae bacterium]|nr:hypothetical protein [Desulfovibrionaceae bacterium]
QQTILAAQYSSLPQGGLLIYLTCTLNPAENEQAVGLFLKERPDASLIFQWESPPHNPAHEFFWAAVLQRNS